MSSTIKLLESTGKGFIRIIKIQKSRLEAMESGTTKRYMVDSRTWWRQKKKKRNIIPHNKLQSCPSLSCNLTLI